MAQHKTTSLLLTGLFFGACLSLQPCKACLWVHGTSLNGSAKRLEGGQLITQLREALKRVPAHENSLVQDHHDMSDEYPDADNDRAVLELLRGNTAQAVEMLQKAEQSKPGQYTTATNLGTALELAGDNAEALRWIKEGIHRNANAHGKSEWLHVQILLTKLQLQQHPDWLDNHTISGIEPSKLRDPHYSIETVQGVQSVYGQNEGSIRYSIGHQLIERMSLVKPRDIIVAQLLRELAQIEMHFGTIEQATEIFASSWKLSHGVSWVSQPTSVHFDSWRA